MNRFVEGLIAISQRFFLECLQDWVNEENAVLNLGGHRR